ncbi:MAG TPA: TRAP transporter substrate-binding protein DctP [Polyangia bacterium]|jgi:TRAP-type C4-dicarboxylate transport system substrate-binding protein
MRALAACLLVLSFVAAPASADEPTTHVLRFAAVIPTGTVWAREMQSFARDVANTTNDEVTLKWYFGGIAGDDFEAGKRIERDQLDGLGAGSWQCERWAPSLTVTRLPGLFHNRDELRYVGSRLRPQLEEEMRKAGMVFLGNAQIGGSILFLRRPVHGFDELRRVKLWSLNDDAVKIRLLRAVGLTLVPMSFADSRAAYDDGRVDGFSAPPVGALAFQWSTEARYVLPLATDYIEACLVISTRAFDRLTFEQQRAIRAAAAKFVVRFDDAGARADDELLGGLFARQGSTTLPVDAKLQADFAAAARAAWDKLDERTVPKVLIRQVQAILTVYRASPH